ncbi:UDP-N-acetylmuramoyl-tripeptide--D-alanyl-D-alanine ligase [Bifidobacterium pullorum subsp. saeculare]|uniref:UDP-N-acetylmuramoyl-tripeptide--D-alanyl-D-alanine ligase n=1 Tax=Bifidobacterium pullorum subsp. saeculare TaxID=78257 RepID=A0A938WUF7_9BIFI|nr:UDP-N-acetylmuramoyl-tripeptide--D-alanyl-D-alanine ligase [Bifidobacterium pullorum]MBM6698935.1 UDP-N-acetylmuramoyl-tripeptide--D-alanyl-D-alanine ligase [Bifidobacterium pullorum subsp. saeculare]
MMRMTIGQVAEAVGGRLEGTPGEAPLCDSAVSDSRQVRPGAVFVAIKGERVDGHDYLAQAAAGGAVCALVDHVVDGAPLAQIVVDDTVAALGGLARRNLELRREAAQTAGATPFTVVGLTGSVGKTTTKDLLATMLARMGRTVAPVGSFNNDIGLPLTACQVGPDTRFLVAEMGANHVGEIAGLTRIAPPDIAIVLKVGVAHLGEFGSVERIAQAKSEIVRGLVPGGMAILNADDPHVAAMAGLAPGEVRFFGIAPANFGRDWLHAEAVATDDADRASFDLVAADGQSGHVTLAIPGAHNVMNALAAASAAHTLGLPLADVAACLASQRTISPHRMAVSTVARGGAAFTLIDDSFNANPDSMRAGLDGLARWGRGAARRPFRVAVLGAMLELGGDEAALHRGIGAYAAGLGIDHIVAVGNGTDGLDALAADLADGARQAGADAGVSVDCVDGIDAADAIVTELARAHAGTVVLLKGSHASGLASLARRWEEPAA